MDNATAPATAANPAANLGATAPTANVDTTTGLLNGTTSSTATPGTAGAAAADATPPGAAAANNPGVDTGTFGTPNANPDFQAGQTAGQAAEFNPAQYSGNSSGVFGQVLKFANDNKVVTAGILQAGGSLLSGLTSTLTPAQVAALNAQANANNAAAALTQQQTANLAMPKAVASSTPVTGTPGQLVPSQPAPAPGLINSAPQLAPVTGTTA
jgi:hypothetical protein